MKILIVDDEETARYGMRKTVDIQGTILEAADLETARSLCHQERPEIILLDLNLQGENGLDLFPDLADQDPLPRVIVVTAHGSEKVAVEAMKQGAFDYIAKPFDIDELRLILRKAAQHVDLEGENRRLREELRRAQGYGPILGTSPPMRQLFSLMEKVAPTDATVLISGESGSGKELVARELHRRSPRANRELVVINCSAIPENLIESELFGHEKGAFTGATQRRIGKFEQARGGTLFLDEIGDMPLETQAKLLRTLEGKQIERLGGNQSIEVDVRILSATNRNLPALVQEGKFRSDLYYRLDVVKLEVPPLRHRKEDLTTLIHHFLELFCQKHGRNIRAIHPQAMARLLDFDYPGNVRQLRNFMERMVVLAAGDEIQERDLPLELRFPSPGSSPPWSEQGLERFLQMPFKEAREAFEVQYLLCQLHRHENNITHTARAIGIHRQSLQQKIKDLQLRKFFES